MDSQRASHEEDGAQELGADMTAVSETLQNQGTSAGRELSEKIGQQQNFLHHRVPSDTDKQIVTNCDDIGNGTKAIEVEPDRSWDSTGTRTIFARINQARHVEKESPDPNQSEHMEIIDEVTPTSISDSRRIRESNSDGICSAGDSSHKRRRIILGEVTPQPSDTITNVQTDNAEGTSKQKVRIGERKFKKKKGKRSKRKKASAD